MASFEERAQLYKNESESFQEYLINLPLRIGKSKVPATSGWSQMLSLIW